MYQLGSVNRRFFLKTAGKISAIVSASLFTPALFARSQGSGAVANSNQSIDALEKSIQANFGSGFRVLSSRTVGQQKQAVIEHLENRYSVVSTNMQDWQILNSTEI
jgi:hypothetical protein